MKLGLSGRRQHRGAAPMKVVSAGLGVGAAVGQQVPDDDEDRVGDGDRRFGPGLLTHPPFQST
jgi:hypothetical protein